MKTIRLLPLLFFLISSFASATPTLEEAIKNWQDRVLDLVKPSGILYQIYEPGSTAETTRRLLALVSQLDWVLPATLIGSQIVTEENRAEAAVAVDEARAEVLKYLDENELRFLLRRYSQKGLVERIGETQMLPSNLIKMLRESLKLGPCENIIQLRPRKDKKSRRPEET